MNKVCNKCEAAPRAPEMVFCESCSRSLGFDDSKFKRKPAPKPRKRRPSAFLMYAELLWPERGWKKSTGVYKHKRDAKIDAQSYGERIRNVRIIPLYAGEEKRDE